MSALTSVYMDGRDLERDREALMRFRLTYEGNLLSNKPHDRAKRAAHKHAIRRRFHPQLKRLWGANQFLRTQLMNMASEPLLPPGSVSKVWAQGNESIPMSAALSKAFAQHDYEYVPLVWEEMQLF